MKFKLLMLFSLVLIAIMALGAVNAANETVTVEDLQESQLSIDQNGTNGGEALVDEVAISDVSNLDENDNSLRQSNNEINNVRGSPVIITPENYKDYLDYGTFIEEYDNVVFKGNFSNIELDSGEAIIVAHPVNISGDGAIFNNICFHVYSGNVTIENMTFIYGGAGHSNALINVYAENVKLNNLNINYTLVDNDGQVTVIFFDSKRNINLTNSKIFFENHATRDATNYMNALNIYECQDVLIDNNTFNSIYPFLLVENYIQEYYMMGLSYINPISIYAGNNIKFTNNYVNTTPNNYSASYPTLQSLYIVGSHDCLIDGNKFFMIDNLTPAGLNNYLYGINFGYNHNLTMSNNEFLMFTKGGIDSNGAAYPFQGVESEVKIIGNKIKSISNGPNLGIYVASMSGGSSELYIADNVINITGLAVTHAWALVSGIEIQNGHAAIYNNTIYTYNIGGYDDNNNIYGISYAQFMHGDRSFDIRNNTIFTEGKYTISIIKTDNSNVTNNYLVAHELDGDDSVIIKDGVNNLILDNDGIKSKVNMTINAANVFMGSNATIHVTLDSENVTGNISLIINGVNITKAIENSNIQFNINNLILGVNNFTIVYSGDGKYKSCKINSSLKCLDGIVNNVTFHDYFDENGNLLDIVPNGATLDFRGNFIASADANYTIAILKPINMISTTKDAFIDLHTSAGSLFGENPGNRFAIYNGGSGTNVSDIIFHNTQVWVENAHHVILNNISAIVEDARVGSGVGATSIRGNSSYVTVKNSYFYTRNNGGSSSLVIAGANYCIFDNNTVRGVGNVGNLIYLTTYNTGLPTGSIANIGNKIINNKLYGPDTPTAICWGFVITGVNTTFANNYINYSGVGVNPQWGASNTNNLTICNNTLVGGASMNLPANTYAYNNTVSGSLTVSSGSIIYNSTANALYISGGKAINITVAGNTAINGANTQLLNSILNGSVSFGSSAKNTTFINNTVFNAVKVQSDNNVICGNIIKTVDTYAIVLGSKKNNNVTENYLYARSKYGDNAVSYSDSSNIVKDNYPIGVTNSTFFNFFDSNGVLLNNNSYDELIFLGDFSGLGVNIINLNRNISILGNNAVLYDMGFLVNASGVVLNNIKLFSNINNFAGNGGAVVLVNGAGVVLSNLDVVCNMDNSADIFAVVANDANGLILQNNKITFTILANGGKISTPVKIDNSNNTIIKNNTVVASIPSYDIEWSYDPVTYEYAPKAKSEGFLIKKSKGVEFKDNNILINVNNKTGNFNTMYGVHAMLCDDLEVFDNKIEVNGSKYAYATIISGQDIDIKNNNIYAHTDDYYAAAIDLEGPATAKIDSNNLTAKSTHVVYVIYSGGFMGRIEAEYTNNNLTGESRFVFGTSLTGVTEDFINNTIMLNGNYTMGVTGDAKYLQIINNTIISNGTNIGSSDGSGDTVVTGVETAGVIIVKQLANANITNNNIKSTGNYTVITEREGNVINNHLIANELLGDDSVKATNNNTTVENNAPFKTGLIITVNDVKYKQKFTIIANLTHKITGEVIATIKNKNYTINIVNGSGSLLVSETLPVGKYLVSAKYNGNQNYLPATNNTTFNITKATLKVNVVSNNITYGQDFIISYALNVSDASGQIVYFLDNYELITLDLGAAVIISNLEAGEYELFVKLINDKNYEDATSAPLNFTVHKATLNINAIASDIAYGQDLVISHKFSKSGASGTVIYFVDGEIVGNSSVGSSISISSLKAGSHTVFVKLVNDENYLDATSSTLNINVAKATLNINAIASNIICGEDLVISHILNVSDASGSVVYFVDGEMVGNSSVGSSVSVSALKAGTYSVVVKLVDDSNYMDAVSDSLAVNVAKASNANITISITPLNPIYGDKVKVNIIIPEDTDGKVLIVLDNKTTIIKAPDESYTLVPTSAGEHTISVSLVNDTNYRNTTTTTKFNVAKKNTVFIAPSLIKYYFSNDKLVVTLKDANGKVLPNKKVTIKINTVTYNLKTDSKGIAKLLIHLKPKSYVAEIKFAGDNNYNVANKKISVKVVTPKIKAVKSKIKRNKYLQVSFKTYNNKAIKNTKVTLKIKGKTYTVKTNSKGIAKLKIKVKKGTYKVKTSFKSPAKYGKTTKTLKIKVI